MGKLGLLVFFLLRFVINAQGQASVPDSLLHSKNTIPSNAFGIKKDSVPKIISHLEDSTKRITASVPAAFDSLRPDYKKYVHHLDSAKAKLSHTIDSLQRVGIPHSQYSKALDSLNKINPSKGFQKLQTKLSQEQSALSRKINQPINNANQKLIEITKKGEGSGLPQGTKSPTISNLNSPLQKADGIPGKGQLPSNLSSTNLKQSMPNDPLSKEVSELKKNVSKEIDPNIQKDLQKDIKDLTNSGELRDVEKESREINNETTKFTKGVSDVQSGKYTDEKALEKEVAAQLPANTSTELQKNAQLVSQQEAMLKSLKNKEEYKKHTLDRARKIATEQLAAQSKQMQPLISKINQYQKDADNLIKQTKGLPKQRPARESVPPLIERFIPAFTWQIQKDEFWRIDLNPSVRFRVKKLISVGTGWNERIVIDQKGNLVPNYRVYGLRNFMEVTFRKGIAVRFDVEHMNAFVPVSIQQQDVGARKWVWSYLAGLKKTFSFGRGITGNTQIMYLLSNQKESPYLNRLNIRFGIEFPIKVKRRHMN